MGRQLAFKGSAWGLLGRWIGWLLLIIVTLGVYSFLGYSKVATLAMGKHSLCRLIDYRRECSRSDPKQLGGNAPPENFHPDSRFNRPCVKSRR